MTLVSEVLVTFHRALLEIVSFEVINAANLSALLLWAWVEVSFGCVTIHVGYMNFNVFGGFCYGHPIFP
jgi:hypothetical protein